MCTARVLEPGRHTTEELLAVVDACGGWMRDLQFLAFESWNEVYVSERARGVLLLEDLLNALRDEDRAELITNFGYREETIEEGLAVIKNREGEEAA